MRELVARYLSHSISRRSFLKGLTTAGISATAANSILESLIPTAHAQAVAPTPDASGAAVSPLSEREREVAALIAIHRE